MDGGNNFTFKQTVMKTLITILLTVICLSCKTWDWGETFIYKIPKGSHQDISMPVMIEGTEKWGGNITLEYDAEEMICPENFAYWNKFGGIMPDLTSNFIEGKHQSARLAWRVDPEDTEYFYLGYIVYVWGEKEPYRDYLLNDGERIRIKTGEQFYGSVVKYDEWWGVFYEYETAYIKIDDPKLKGEDLMVVMDPYYGGVPVAPTDITITLEIIDTTWLY